MQKCKAIGLLNDARDNIKDLLEGFNIHGVEHLLIAELDELEKAIKNPTAFAMDILRHDTMNSFEQLQQAHDALVVENMKLKELGSLLALDLDCALSTYPTPGSFEEGMKLIKTWEDLIHEKK